MLILFLLFGQFKVGCYVVGWYVEYDRVEDYWGKDLLVFVGYYNFDMIWIEFFWDYQVVFEVFKKGDVEYQEEFSFKIWVMEYNFLVVEDGWVVCVEFLDGCLFGV